MNRRSKQIDSDEGKVAPGAAWFLLNGDYPIPSELHNTVLFGTGDRRRANDRVGTN